MGACAPHTVIGLETRRHKGLELSRRLSETTGPQSPNVFRVAFRTTLDYVIVLDERHLRRILRKYVDYYHSCRTHLSLEKDAPKPRRVESSAMGKVSAIPKVSSLHRHYTRCMLESDPLGTAAGLRTRLHLYL